MKSFPGKLKLEATFICFLLLFGTSVSPILAADGSKDGAYSDAILIDNLEDIGTESIGIINDEQGGLGINLWQSRPNYPLILFQSSPIKTKKIRLHQ